MTIKNIRDRLGLSRDEFAERFKVKKRTLECWEYETRNPPEHVQYMLERILELEEQVDSLTKELARYKKKN